MPKYKCKKCGFIHIFKKKILEGYGNKFQCRKCKEWNIVVG